MLICSCWMHPHRSATPSQPEFILLGFVPYVIHCFSFMFPWLTPFLIALQLLGASAFECDTIPSRQCMSSCFFILRSYMNIDCVPHSITLFFFSVSLLRSCWVPPLPSAIPSRAASAWPRASSSSASSTMCSSTSRPSSPTSPTTSPSTTTTPSPGRRRASEPLSCTCLSIPVLSIQQQPKKQNKIPNDVIFHYIYAIARAAAGK